MEVCKRPKLKILIGPPGTGKSFWAKKYIAETDPTAVIASSDAIRLELFEDETCQKDPGKVLELMRERAHEALLYGKTVIWDATNMTRKNRATAISSATPETEIEAVIVWDYIDNIIVKDAGRKRCVGKNVIMRMLRNFQYPYYDEGIDKIKIEGNKYYNGTAMVNTTIDQENSHHTLTVKDHCHKAWEYAMLNNYSYDVCIAASLHDCGKPETKSFFDTKGNPSEEAHYYGHQGVSAWKAISDTRSDFQLWLISAHMEPYFDSKYYRKLSPWMKYQLDNLHKCDEYAH